ncbi:MAG: hypothetical protein M1820_003110 [Bogoriella megaspora]|nr:MAG: hypothetical protein M1820_003110 [Bogoriella megaspora]
MAAATTSLRAPMPSHWVDHYLSKIDRDVKSTTEIYEKQRATHEEADLVKVEQSFSAAMREYQTIVVESDSRLTNKIPECDSWNDLAALMKETEAIYSHETNTVRRLSRTVGDYANALSAWANLLPSDQNTSIIAGGVKLLLRAAGRRSAQRERILATFGKFLGVVADSEQCLREFGGDAELRRCAVTLYVAMLKTVEATINSLISDSLWKKVKYGFFGERASTIGKLPAETVDRICSHCDDMQQMFSKRVQAMTRTKIVETASATRRVEAQVTKKMAPSVQRTENVTTETYVTAKEIQENGRQMDLNIRKVSDSVETQGDILLNIREMLRDLLANNEWQREAEERRSQTTRLQVENYQLGLEHMRNLAPTESLPDTTKKWFLWKIIDIDPERCVAEAELMLRNSQGSSHAPAQVLKMYRHRRVKDFLTSAASDSIFVEAPHEGQEMSRCSSMSLACAMLLQDISSHAHAAAIHYFCGSHNSIQDPTSGAAGIARILIGQILCLQEFDLTFLNEEWSAALDQGDPYALFKLFEPLVAQLKTTTLFCIIDTINLFEGNQRKDETITLIYELLRVTLGCPHSVNFKLLLTSASRSRYIAPIFQHEGVGGLVRLPEDDGDAEVSTRAVKLEIARSGLRPHSGSIGSISSHVGPYMSPQAEEAH